MMVASIVTARAFMILEKAISQSVQVLGFMRLGLMPNTRNGTENGPRKAIGMFRFCQQPRHSLDGSGVIAFPRRCAVNLAPARSLRRAILAIRPVPDRRRRALRLAAP